MSLNKLKKDELKLVCLELGINVPVGATVIILKDLIETSNIFKENQELFNNVVESVLEEKQMKADREQREKLDSETKLELEKIKLAQLERELEIVNIRKESQLNQVTSSYEPENRSLENIIKSIKTLTISVPTKAESFNLFFKSLEKAFGTKNVPEEMKAEILLNILGEKASNLMVYLSEEDLSNYVKLKEIVLKEFQPTAHECLLNFRRAQKLPTETHAQFASRLSATFEYYVQLRNVDNLKKLCELMVSDKIYSTLDRDLQSHISVKQGESWYNPQELAKHCDIYLGSKNKTRVENPYSRYTGNDNKRFEKNTSQNYNSRNISKVFVSEVKNSKCVLCKTNGNHPLYYCPNFKKLSINERIEIVRSHNMCFKCLSPNCSVKRCNSRNCFCGKPHNKLIHIPREKDVPSDLDQKNVAAKRVSPVIHEGERNDLPVENSIAAASCMSNKNETKMVLLSTVQCLIKDRFDQLHECRCLLDGGSMANFVSLECAERLQLKPERINMVVSCLNDSSMRINRCVKTAILNKNKSFERELSFLVVEKITDLTPSKPLRVSDEILDNVKLADNSFKNPGKIDILIGAEVFYELLKPGQIYSQNSQLILQNSVFGYIASGSVTELNNNKLQCGLIREGDLNQTLKQFWEIENVETELIKSKETEICEEHFQRTHLRDSDGRYIVTMPLKKEPACLGKSKDIAIKRLNSLWNRLSKDPEYLSLYKEFLREYEILGHMQEIKEEREPGIVYYLPHHGVFRPEKSTTKLRVVFNASSPTNNGTSLNSLQYNGGVIQDDLFTIMTRFRRHQFAFTADIEKMYRMIQIHPKQRSLQRILWKEGPNEQIKIFELATVTYGTVSAPYLAMRTLEQLSIDEKAKFPLAAQILTRDFYMDDVLSGAQTMEDAQELQRQLIGILKTGGMTLHKWCLSHPQLSTFSEEDYKFVNPDETKTLGISWRPKKDCFTFQVKVEMYSSFTKRSVLSTIARLFDPLGLLGPIITKAKIFMQKMWLLKIGWDELLPEKETREWQGFLQSLPVINDIAVDRCIISNCATVIELHGFADACESAYGAVIYSKCSTNSGKVSVTLIASKSRVSPLKRATIPRLELCAAVLLAKLMKKVRAALQLEVSKVYLWSDSTIVLCWIQKEPIHLKTFVSNRVASIQELTCISDWHHVPSEQNPADLISRGLDPERLFQNNFWFHGPEFLTMSNYPNQVISVTENKKDFDRELKNSITDSNCSHSVLSVSVNASFYDIINVSNKYNKMIRVCSFVFRFIKNCRNKGHKIVGPLNHKELREAENFLIRQIQQEEFGKEFKALKDSGNVPLNSQVRSLHPFIDKDGLLRVGGRLENSNLSYECKFPILLPAKHKVTRQIIEYCHQKYFHLGPQALLFQVRQKFWPLHGRTTCRKVVHECIPCFKVKPIVCDQLMGGLPKERVRQNHPFNCSGVDFAGPFLVRYKNQRKGVFHKIYVAIFVCFVTRAIHLEIVTELSTQAFIATLKRFFARRGVCSNLYSDNATNFVGSKTELKRLFNMVNQPDDVLSGYLSNENIEWKFLPPRAPNFGGLWEAGVKSFKFHLKRVMGNSKLTYEEFLTVVTQVEGILNSRPLTPLTADIDDLKVLTPGHFLIGRPLTTIIEPNITEFQENKLNCWQRTTKMVQLIWRKWSNDYLTHLQQRTKWFFDKSNVKINDMVIVKEDNMAVCNWPLGRIIECFPGKDNKIRVVTVKTQRGLFKRPISKICLLPIE